MQYHTFILSNAGMVQTDGLGDVVFQLLVFVYIAATLFTLGHCVFHDENQDRLPYVLGILLLPVAGAVLYWKDRPDIFNIAITMAYPPSSEKKADGKDTAHSAQPADQRFSTPPFPVKKAPHPRYSSPPFSALETHPLRTSNSTPPFATAVTENARPEPWRRAL